LRTDYGTHLRKRSINGVGVALMTATKGLIGARELDLMKENAILINVARGEIVYEDPGPGVRVGRGVQEPSRSRAGLSAIPNYARSPCRLYADAIREP